MSIRTWEREHAAAGGIRSRLSLRAPATQLALLLVAFLGVGVFYSVVVPIWEAPDENAHFAYARYLADTGRLPVQDPANPGRWYQEGSQPPLYYALVASVIRPVDTGDFEALRWYNPQNVMGHPAEAGNKNRFIHTDRERFPYQNTVLAVHLARLVSLLMGAGTVWLTYLIARRIFAGEPTPALAAAAFVAFLPQFQFISAAVNNDSAVTLFSTATLYLLLRLVQGDVETETRFLSKTWFLPALGLTLGLALLSKLSAMLLVPFVVLVLAVVAWRRRSIRWFLTATAVVLAVAAMVAGWWFVRNVQLYGDPMGTNAMMEIAGRRYFELREFLAGTWGEFRGLRWSFWALFGWFSLPIARSLYLALDLLSLLVVVGLVPVLWRALRQRNLPLLTVTLWPLVVFSGLVWWTTFAKGAQGRLLFPAIASIGVLFVAGLRTWLSPRLKTSSPALVGLPMLAFALWCLAGVIQPAYARPPLVEPSAIPPDAARPQVTFGNQIQLLGVIASPSQAEPGDPISLTFYWQAQAPVKDDVLLNVRFYGHDLALLVNEDTYPGWGTFPPAMWPVGPVIVDRYRFDLPADADVPTLVRVDVGFVDRTTDSRWATTDAQGEPISQPTFVDSFHLRQTDPQRAAPDTSPVARLDDGIVLLSYQITPTLVHAGESVTVTLEWGAEAAPALDYTVLAHLVNASGRVVAQADGAPRGGDYPTGAWLSGDRVPDTRVVDVPADAVPGDYHLRVGMYRLDTLERLPAHDATGRRLPGDAIPLGQPVRVSGDTHNGT